MHRRVPAHFIAGQITMSDATTAPDPEPYGHRQIDSIANEHLNLYRAIERMSSDAEMVRRETGRHALWLGYPLLYAGAEGEILAPVFLWPIDIRLDHRHQGSVYIGRAQLPP